MHDRTGSGRRRAGGSGRALLALVALALASAGAQAGERVEDPSLGYSVEVPEGWRFKLDELEQYVLMGAPDGFRVRIEVEERSGELDRNTLASSYRRDGKQLLARFGKVKVVRRPQQDAAIGGEKAWGYRFVYRDEAGLGEMRTWLAAGPAQDPDLRLLVKLRAYGPRPLQGHHEPALRRILASFGWPAREVLEVEPEPEPEPEPEVRAVPPVMAVVDMPPGDVGELVDTIREDPGIRSAIRSALGGGGGYSQGVPEGHDGNARAYDRGSLSGGVGFMRQARRITDARKVRQLETSFRVKNRGRRSEEEKKRAAAYLGFELD